MITRNIALLLAALFLSVASHSAHAHSATGNLVVTAGVLDTCTVVVSPIAFATLNAATVANETAPGTITVMCTLSHGSATLSLGSGDNASGGSRRMTDGGGNFVS